MKEKQCPVCGSGYYCTGDCKIPSRVLEEGACYCFECLKKYSTLIQNRALGKGLTKLQIMEMCLGKETVSKMALEEL